jgi:hypothetical protein
MKAIKSDSTADLRHFDSGAPRFWSPELRRAMMKVRPEYFSWPLERREGYGVAIPKTDAASLDKALLKELFGKSYATRKEAATAAGRLSLDEQDRWNETVLPLHGIGEDCFYLNESFAKDKNILDFDTVRAFDESDYRFQEKARRKEDPEYSGKPYRGSLYLNWARLYVDGRFAYATLSMAAGYIYARLSDVAHELLARLVPHRYVPGKHHGKVEGGGCQWDLRVDANGQEGVFEELQRQIWRYEQERYDALLTSWDRANRRGVYLLDCSEPPEVHWHFVFSDARVLSSVRFRSFLRDCRAVERSAEELVREVDTEKAALKRYIEDQHAHIRRTYDPKVRRLHRRRKIVVMKGAFDNLK